MGNKRISLHKCQHGMSLVEVMVALLVLGIGVMGYAALQLRSVRMTEDTYARSQAMSIAQDAIERIRANRNAIDDYTGADWQADPADPEIACTLDSPCTAAQMAQADVNQLKAIVSSTLPTGSISVVPCTSLACVTVAWNETPAADCNESDIHDNDRGDAAHCVTISFIEG